MGVAESNKKRWAQLTPEKRKQLMDATRASRWSGVSKKKRTAHARMMAEKKWEKSVV